MKIFAPLGLATLLAGAAWAQEPPPPAVGPELAPSVRLVDPRADELVKQMSDLLTSTKSFALEAEEIYDEVPEQLPRTQLTNLRHVALRRPDRFVGDASGDAINRSFGRGTTPSDKEQTLRASVPPTTTAPSTPSSSDGKILLWTSS
jgi:hypothetical protein